MGVTRAGIQRLAVWSKNKDDLNNIIALFQRSAGKMTITDKDDLKDYRGRVMPSLTNVKIEATEFGVGRPLLYYLNQLALGGGVSAEVIGAKTGASTFEGIYKFLGSSEGSSQHLGLDFEYTSSNKQRAAKIMLEGSFEWEVWKAIVANSVYAGTSHAQNLNNLALAQYNTSYLQAPQLNGLFTTYPTRVFDNEQVIEYNFTVRPLNNKTGYDKAIIYAYEIKLEVTITKAAKDDIISFAEFPANQAFSLGLGWKTPAGWAQETHAFAAGVFGLAKIHEIGDENRTTKLTFVGQISPFNLGYAVAGNGLQYTYSL